MRYFLAIVLVATLVLLIIILIKLLQDSSSKHKIKKHLRSLFKDMEKEYEKFIKQKLDFEIIKNENLNINSDELVSRALTILKPYIESLYALASSNEITQSLGLNIDSEHFKNLYFVTERLLMHKLPLTTLEKDELFQALEDALKADISKRLLQLKTGI